LGTKPTSVLINYYDNFGGFAVGVLIPFWGGGWGRLLIMGWWLGWNNWGLGWRLRLEPLARWLEQLGVGAVSSALEQLGVFGAVGSAGTIGEVVWWNK